MLSLRGSYFVRAHRNYSSKINAKMKSFDLPSTEIRKIFLDYFVKEHNHKFIRSSPVIPFCDPTVPFVNAGMNQVRDDYDSRNVRMNNRKKKFKKQKC